MAYLVVLGWVMTLVGYSELSHDLLILGHDLCQFVTLVGCSDLSRDLLSRDLCLGALGKVVTYLGATYLGRDLFECLRLGS